MHKKYITYQYKHIRNVQDTCRLKSRPVYGVDAKLVRCCFLKFWAAGRCDGGSRPGQFCQADSLGPEPAGGNQDNEAPLHLLLLHHSHALIVWPIIRVHLVSSRFCGGPWILPSMWMLFWHAPYTNIPLIFPPEGCGLFEQDHNGSKSPNNLKTMRMKSTTFWALAFSHYWEDLHWSRTHDRVSPSQG